VEALTRQADLASSIRILSLESHQEAYDGEIDWALQIKLSSAPGPVETRRKRLRLRIGRLGKTWRITALAPVEFFRPPG
jgi:hypothetical protein